MRTKLYNYCSKCEKKVNAKQTKLCMNKGHEVFEIHTTITESNVKINAQKISKEGEKNIWHTILKKIPFTQ